MPTDLSAPPSSIPVLDKGFVGLVTEPNSDLKVVNAARVSFSKRSTLTEETIDVIESERGPTLKRLSDGDVKLINYLARNNHWTPFAHCRALTTFDNLPDYLWLWGSDFTAGMEWPTNQQRGPGNLLSLSLAHTARLSTAGALFRKSCPESVAAMVACTTEPVDPLPWSECPELEPFTFHIKLPIFVARQFMRSNGGLVYNEVSRRYVDNPPEVYIPDKLRLRPLKGIKQGSHPTEAHNHPLEHGRCNSPGCLWCDLPMRNLTAYGRLVEMGYAPELARIVLPQSTYTELWVTGSRRAFERVINLRKDSHAQWEIQQYALALESLMKGT